MTWPQILFHFRLVFRPVPHHGRPCAEKMWWAPTTLTAGSLHYLIKSMAILSALLLLLPSEHPRLKWANIHYLPVSAGQELKSGFTGWFRFRAFYDVAGKLPARAADSGELDWDCRMCPQAYCHGFWHISEYLFPSSLTLLQADRPKFPAVWASSEADFPHHMAAGFLLLGLPHEMEADFT